MDLAAAGAAGVRKVISRALRPPATSARARGTPSLPRSMVITGTTGAARSTSSRRARRMRGASSLGGGAVMRVSRLFLDSPARGCPRVSPVWGLAGVAFHTNQPGYPSIWASGGAQVCGHEGSQGDSAGAALAAATYKCGLSRSQHTTVPRYPLFRAGVLPPIVRPSGSRRTTLTLWSVSTIVRAAISAHRLLPLLQVGADRRARPQQGNPIRVGLRVSR
jgi:hypothetical protein